MKNTIRTFVAVEINASVRARADAMMRQLAAVAAGIKWVEAHNLHFSLKFLGDVPLVETPKICKAVEAAAATIEPFELDVQGAGAFPHSGQPRTLWLGAGAGGEQLVALAEAIEAALKKLGYPPEGRPFQPHLTIGRVRQGDRVPAEFGKLIQEQAEKSFGQTTVDEVVVFSSRLDRAGPTYEALGHAPLGG